MPTYANQRRVITHKSKFDGQFGQYPLDALQLACRNLNKGGLVLWLDFAKNADEYAVDLSPAAIKKMYGSAEKTTQRAIEELEEQHYLVKNPNDSYKYDFYLYPQNTPTQKTIPSQKLTPENKQSRIEYLLNLD